MRVRRDTAAEEEGREGVELMSPSTTPRPHLISLSILDLMMLLYAKKAAAAIRQTVSTTMKNTDRPLTPPPPPPDEGSPPPPPPPDGVGMGMHRPASGRHTPLQYEQLATPSPVEQEGHLRREEVMIPSDIVGRSAGESQR